MELNIGNEELVDTRASKPEPKRKPKRRVEILADETIGDGDIPSGTLTPPDVSRPSLRSPRRSQRSLLNVDSTGLGSVPLEGPESQDAIDAQQREVDAEMAKAVGEVEKLRLEMQRASETIEGPAEGVIVKRKKKRRTTAAIADGGATVTEPPQEEEQMEKKKKKKKKKPEEEDSSRSTEVGARVDVSASTNDGATAMNDDTQASELVATKKKKGKRRQITIEDETLPSAT